MDPKAITWSGKKKNRKKNVDEAKLTASKNIRTEATKALIEVLIQWETELVAGLGTKSESRDLVESSIHDYWSFAVKHKDDLAILADGKQSQRWGCYSGLEENHVCFLKPIGEKIIDAQKIIDGKIGEHNAGFYENVADVYILDEKFIERAKANLNWDHEGTRKAAKAVLDMHAARKAHSDKTQVMVAGMNKAAEYALKNKTDNKLGEALFNKVGCITCHAVNNSGIQKDHLWEQREANSLVNS